MYKRIILIAIFIIILPNVYIYGDDFKYLPTDEKVEYLLKNIYGNVRENNKLASLKYFKELIITIYHEKKEATSDGKRILNDLLYEIYNLAKIVKSGSILKLSRIKDMAIDTFESLALNYNYKITYFKQKGFKKEVDIFQRRARKAKFNSLVWGGKSYRNSDEKEIVKTFSELGKNSIKGIGNGFKSLGNGLGHLIGIDRLEKRRENRKKVKDLGLWD